MKSRIQFNKNISMKKETKQTQTGGGVVVNKDGLILVVSQRNNYTWSLPKGHVEDGENAIDAAKREIYEESGINELEYLSDLGSYQRYKMGREQEDDTSEMKTIHMFLFKTEQTELKPIDPENPEARWVEKDKVADLLTHSKDKEFFLSIKDKITIL